MGLLRVPKITHKTLCLYSFSRTMRKTHDLNSETERLRTEGVKCCTDCKALGGKFVIFLVI